jgi:hypothetical protein
MLPLAHCAARQLGHESRNSGVPGPFCDDDNEQKKRNFIAVRQPRKRDRHIGEIHDSPQSREERQGTEVPDSESLIYSRGARNFMLLNYHGEDEKRFDSCSFDRLIHELRQLPHGEIHDSPRRPLRNAEE